MLFLVAFYGLFAALIGGHGRGARRHRRRAGARIARAAVDHTGATARARRRQMGRHRRARCSGRRDDAPWILPDAAFRAAAGGRHSVPVQRHRARPLPRRAGAARAADARGDALRRRARAHVPGGAGERLAAADVRGFRPVPAHVPAEEGPAVAHLGAGVGPVLAAVARAARRSAPLARSRCNRACCPRCLPCSRSRWSLGSCPANRCSPADKIRSTGE